MEETTLYEQFVYEMEKIGLRKKFSVLEEKDITLSDGDEVIYITVNDCHILTIKGIKESMIRGKIITPPYYVSMKVYGYDGEEMMPEDTVQFSITEFKTSGFPTAPEIRSHIIYYHYPYSVASSKLRLKRGIIITKDRRLEMRVMRNRDLLKIAKLELKMECDKWFKKV